MKRKRFSKEFKLETLPLFECSDKSGAELALESGSGEFYGAKLHVVNAYQDSLDYPDRDKVKRIVDLTRQEETTSPISRRLFLGLHLEFLSADGGLVHQASFRLCEDCHAAVELGVC